MFKRSNVIISKAKSNYNHDISVGYKYYRKSTNSFDHDLHLDKEAVNILRKKGIYRDR